MSDFEIQYFGVGGVVSLVVIVVVARMSPWIPAIWSVVPVAVWSAARFPSRPWTDRVQVELSVVSDVQLGESRSVE